MNVLVVNQQEDILSPLNIEIIKTMRGTFTADEIISTFTNFFFSRMIIDITALQAQNDLVTYQKLSIGLPIDKIILLIPANSPVANNFFLSKLISMGYYNFTTNGEGIIFLLNTPNTYKEVAHLHQAEVPAMQMPMQMPMQQAMPDPLQPMMQQPQPQMEMPQQPLMPQGVLRSGIHTIGIRNVTDEAGASTLIYMMKKELEANNKSVLALEIDKRDFTFFKEKNMVSTDKFSIAQELVKANGYEYVLVDLNNYEDPICDEVLYLIEPSVIRLNKLILRDRNIFSKIKNEKIIINKSTLSQGDVREFSQEAGIKIFYVLPPLNDRERSKEVYDFLVYLGLM